MPENNSPKLGKSPAAAPTDDAVRRLLDSVITPRESSFVVNVGMPGNIRKLTLDGSKSWTVAAVLSAAEMNAAGYEVRVAGNPVAMDAQVLNGQTVLLLRPVRGNFDLDKDEPKMTINVGVPGNMRRIALKADQQWTVADALKAAEIDPAGYEIRVGGNPVQQNAPIANGQTVLLLRPVRGN